MYLLLNISIVKTYYSLLETYLKVPKDEDRRLTRINKSKLNAMVALGTSIIMGIASFVERMVFNRFFIADYLGLYNLFNNIMGMLSITNLGLGTSIAYSLYEPLANDDEAQISATIKLYHSVYKVVGTIILVGGLIVLPCLKFMVNTSIDIGHVRLYFVFYIIRTCMGYFLSPLEILVNANQDHYKTTLVTNTCWTLLYIAQIVISLLTQDFLLYSAAITFFAIARTLTINHIARKDFPYLKKYGGTKVRPERVKRLIKNTKGLLYSKFGDFLFSAADSTLISMLVNTATLGRYANYIMISKGMRTVCNLLPTSITASIGDAGVTESKHDLSGMFKTLNVSCFLIYSTITVLLINISTPFVTTFFGPDRGLPFVSVVLIFADFYLACQRTIISTFKSSLGLYWEDRWRPILAGVINLISSIILGNLIGLNGILLGTVISYLSVNSIFEPLTVIHLGLHTSAVWYFISTLGHLLLTSGVTALTLLINSFLPLTGIAEVLVKAVVTLTVTLAIYYLIYHKTEEYAVIVNVLKQALRKKKK